MTSNFWSDPWAVFAVGFVIFLGTVALTFLWKRHKVLAGEIDDFERNLTGFLDGTMKPPEHGAAAHLWSLLREHLLFPSQARAVQQLVPLRNSLEPSLKQAVPHLLREGAWGVWAHLLGRSLTGVALILTFGLLGYVLIGPVHSALSVSGEGQSAQLSLAIGQMGAKFFVSAVGVAFSLLFQAFADWSEKTTRRHLLRAWRTREHFFDSPEAYRARAVEAQRKEVAELRTELAGLQRALTVELVHSREELGAKLDKLENVEVTLQGIGDQVQVHFGTLMKQHVADVIRDKLASVEESVRTVAEELQKQMAAAFGSALTAEMLELRKLLVSLQETVAGQSQSDLERLLQQLGDAVSGGFQSQSTDMGRQLAQLTEVLPRLEAQFSQMSTSLTTSAQEWGQENHRAVQTLTGQIGAMLASFTEVQARIERSAAQFSETTVNGSAQLQQASREQLSVMAESLREARQAAAQDSSQFERQVQLFTESIARTQEGLLEVTKGLQRTAKDVALVLQQAGDVQGRTHGSITRLDDAAQRMVEGAKAFAELAQKREALVGREEQFLTLQRQAVDALTPALKDMLHTYEESVRKQSQLLAEQWGKLAGNVKNVVEHASGQLAEGVDELSSSVDDLKKVLQTQSGRRA